jgi:hypothetical protein
MLILPQTVLMTWTPKTKKYYVEKGYVFSKIGDAFHINVLDLSIASNKYVDVYCDYCLKKIPKIFSSYNKERKIVKKDCCKDCQQQKREDVFMVNHNVTNPSYLPEVIDKIMSKKRTPLSKVRKDFNNAGYTLLSKFYKNSKKKLSFICKKHKDLDVQRATYESLLQERLICRGCLSERKSFNTKGEKNPLWRGGKRNLNTYLRGTIGDWIRQSYLNSNSKCIISGETDGKKLVVHHLYSLINIIEESLNELNLKWKETVNKYTTEDLALIEKKVNDIHCRYPLGVVIEKSLHYEFHSIYGNRDNTPEQFMDYLEKYHPQASLELSYPVPTLKYYPIRRNKSTRFTGITFVSKQQNKFFASLKHHGKTINIGSYETDFEAAYFFNIKAKELRGENTTINYLTNDEINFVQIRISNAFYNKKNKYKYVTKRKNKWESTFKSQGKYYYIGSFDSEVEAVIACNTFILKNKINKELQEV